MKKIVLTLIVLLFATPAFAVVNITAAIGGEPNEVIISWEAVDEPNFVRAFGLNIQLDSDANILEVTGLSADYWVHPGTIQIDAQGEVTYEGTIAAEYDDLPSDTLEGIGSGGVTLEAASLYAPVGAGPNAPDLSGDLASIIVSADCNLCITANVSRAGATGVVMEDPDQAVTVNYPAECLFVDIPDEEPECYEGMVDYDEWEAVGKPLGWCIPRQCHGDTDDLVEGNILAGYYYVGPDDLNLFISVYKLLEPASPPTPSGPGIDSVPNGINCDFAHAVEGNILAGYYRVGPDDLNILIASYKVLEPASPPTPSGPGVPPDCLD